MSEGDVIKVTSLLSPIFGLAVLMKCRCVTSFALFVSLLDLVLEEGGIMFRINHQYIHLPTPTDSYITK